MNRHRRYGRFLTLSLLSLALLAPRLHAEPRPEPPAAAIDVNTATAEELATVRGIGKVTAERIVAFREEHGPFARLEELLKVQGIGEKSLAKIAPQLVVKPQE